MQYLALSLGHNSSALYYDSNTRQVIGFEEERLTRKKNDSSFPINALKRIERLTKGRSSHQVPNVLVSHWFDRFDPKIGNKYWDHQHFDKPVLMIDHHLAHAWSAVAFYEEHARLIKPCDILVIDGFGNSQNCFSVYEYDPTCPDQLGERVKVYGYDRSIGLLYQWAAELCGMDGHADVYKFLGYRTHVEPFHVEQLNLAADHITSLYLDRIMANGSKYPPLSREDKGVIDVEYFNHVKEKTKALLQRMIPDCDDRTQVGYVVQKVLEDVTMAVVNRWIQHDRGRALLVAGGCFYNVRLNMILSEKLPNSFCPMPIAGDQGCVFGLIRSQCATPLGLVRHFNIGPRAVLAEGFKFQKFLAFRGKPTSEVAHAIAGYIDAGWIVNLIDGHTMEFGPRSLCHTSTLCLPTTENVEIINSLNQRNTVMPMAPVMTRAWGYKLFGEQLNKVEGGEKFMICAFRYLPGVVDQYNIHGAAHLDLDGTWSGRPQIVDQRDDFLMHSILFHGGWPCLINTSFNFHGEPICFGPASVLQLHGKWLKKSKRIMTIWVE